MEKKVLILFSLLSLFHSLEVYIDGWIQGFYHQDGTCKPCQPSWRSWSGALTCDTCQPYLQLNSTTNLWEAWNPDEYFDETLQVCRSCLGSCNKAWKYRPECFEWLPSESFDLESLTCISDWTPNTTKIESNQLNIPSVWRGLEYYVDPYSEEILELGTKEYPYRSMRHATMEITNFYSHSDAEITIYSKEAYLEDGKLFFINMTSVTITSHPDYLERGKKAVLVSTPE